MTRRRLLPTDREFEDFLQGSDLLSNVVRTHQALDTALNVLISESLPTPHALEIERLTSAFKIDLAVALRVIPSSDAPAFRKVNHVRNTFAHDPHASFTAQNARDLANLLSERQRSLMGEDFTWSEPLQLLRQVFRGLFVDLTAMCDHLREHKLRAEVLHEMVVDRVGNLSPSQAISDEIEERLAAKMRLLDASESEGSPAPSEVRGGTT